MLSYLTTPLRSHSGKAFVLLPAALMFACFAFSDRAEAACTELCDANHNVAFGEFVIQPTTGTFNVAVGSAALQANKTGLFNTAVGAYALNANTARENTAIGSYTLAYNTGGENNTALGNRALFVNNTGNNNVATGFSALNRNTTGYNNTATGFQALFSNTGDNAFNNTATGSSTLQSNTSGNTNTADGAAALFNNKTGNINTAEGAFALSNNTSGSSNIALGYSAGANLTTGNNNIDIGNKGKAGEANTIRIGTQGTQKGTFIAGISGTAISGAQVVVSSTGKLGVAGSSARFKEQIKPMGKASEAILALKPVTFHYKEELDLGKIPQFGLIAEEVAKVNPDLVLRDEDGKVMTVRYEAVNAMLLNEFLKAHRQLQEQQKEIAILRAELKQQEVFIEKVNDKVERREESQTIATTFDER
jgi:hypothetical protein